MPSSCCDAGRAALGRDAAAPAAAVAGCPLPSRMTGDLKTLGPVASAPNSPGVPREGRAAAGAAATPREAAKALAAEKPIEECARGVCVSGEAMGNDAAVNGFHEAPCDASNCAGRERAVPAGSGKKGTRAAAAWSACR